MTISEPVRTGIGTPSATSHGTTTEPRNSDNPLIPSPSAAGWPTTPTIRVADQIGKYKPKTNPVHNSARHLTPCNHSHTTKPRNSDNPLIPSPSAAGWPTTPTIRVADQIGKYKPKTNPVHKGIRRQPSMQPRPHRKPQHINDPPTPQRPATGTPATQPSEPADQTGNRTTTSEPVHAGIGTHPTAQTVHANQVSIGKRSHLSASTDAETPLSVGRGLRDTRHGVPEVGQHMIRCPEPDLTMRPSDPNCMTCRPKPDCAVFRLITRNPAG